MQQRLTQIIKIILVFRFDDYSAKSNTEFELQIIDIFRKYNIPLTIGVIPFEVKENVLDPKPQGNIELDEYKSGILKEVAQEGIVEVALHGYSHQSHSEQFIGSEFRGLDIEKQKEKIRKEKNFLEDRLDTTIYTFIPPWNQYDQNTLKVLDSFNFRCISAGIRGPSNDKLTKINLIPNTCGLNNVLEGIEAAADVS